MGCLYPGAHDLRQLWENILARRQQFRRNPDKRLPLSDYYDADPEAPDKTYCPKMAVIDGFTFDWSGRRIPKSTFESTDIVHWLALEIALKALEDAGYTRDTVPKELSGVILGNTLTGEQTRSQAMRLRWPFVRKALRASAETKGLPAPMVDELEDAMEAYYKSVFAPITEDTLAGGLSNTIAGRICNYLDFHGGGYTVDGACSSSLIAIATAATALVNRDLDFALAGGADISLDTFELIGFAKTGALTKEDMRVYDRRASGFIPGEGAGFAVLKRLEDARRDGNYVYAVIKGWGISSDGKGGITAPRAETQALAISRALARVDYNMRDVDFIEGHGTGTAVGDKAELAGISLAMGDGGDNPLRSLGVTSLKSIIGHTKAAAGIGGFIKAVMAANHRVIPPTAGCSEPNPIFENSAGSLYPAIQGEIRQGTETLRTGITGAGFGGINCHVTIEAGDPPSKHLYPAIEERALLVSNQETELFVFDAESIPDLFRRIQGLKQIADGMSIGELIDLASKLSQEVNPVNSVRAAIIAGRPEGFLRRLHQLEQMLTERNLSQQEVIVSPQQDIFIGNNVRRRRIGFLFPGQGSQQINMARKLVERYQWARELVDSASGWLSEVGSEDVTGSIYRPIDRASNKNQTDEWSSALTKTEIAQPAICLASLIWIYYLKTLGISPVAAGGHSLGELTAFHMAGAFDEKALLQLAAIRGQAMAAGSRDAGKMASIGCSREQSEALLKRTKGYAVVANINSPSQTVISGEKSAIEEAVRIAEAEGIHSKVLRVSNAFHSHFVEAVADQLRKKAPIPDFFGQSNLKLFSCMDGKEIHEGINLRGHFATQILHQVDFISLTEAITSGCDLLIEVGPGRVLSGLVKAIDINGPPCFPVESRPGFDKDVNALLGYLFITGNEMNWNAFYENRLVREFIPASERIFIENQCERPFDAASVSPLQTVRPAGGWLETTLSKTAKISQDELSDYLSQRGDFLSAVIQADLKTLPSFHKGPEKTSEERISEPAASVVAETGQATKNTQASLPASDLLLEIIEKRTGFPKESLSPALRLLDNLNLDSIKTAELIAEASKRLNVVGQFDPTQFANATILEVSEELEKALQAKEEGPSAEQIIVATTGKQTWVRNFVIECVPEKIPSDPIKSYDWTNSRILILSESEEQTIARAVEEEILNQGAAAQCLSFAAFIDKKHEATDFTGCICILPGQPAANHSLNHRLTGIIGRLQSVAASPFLSDPQSEKTIAYIQFGSGYFGAKAPFADTEQICALAFASSLHLERPALKVRVMDFSPGVAPASLAERAREEISTPQSFAASGYDEKLVRRIRRPGLSDLSTYKPRDIAWSSEDVILVTGGAKGITAACALAFAKETDVRIALVGSSPYPVSEQDRKNEITQTLEKYQRENLTARYYQCNISDAREADALIRRIRKEMGEITGVIHGAGVNKPRPVGQVTSEEACNEISPKVLGATNLCDALKDTPLKIFIGFSSIIGITGMLRNAWYGFSNEALNMILGTFREQHPKTHVLSIAFSIWDEVGMGVRLGSTEFLAKMGIDAIPKEEGIRRFLHLVMNDPGESMVVVTARLAGLDTWQPEMYPIPEANRFVEKVEYYYPGVEVTARVQLSLEKDEYIKDHIWRGTYLFPTVFGLEAMAQAVAYVTGTKDFRTLRIENILLERPIAVNPATGAAIEIRARVLEKEDKDTTDRVHASISTEQTGFAIDHFSATFVLGIDDKAPIEHLEIPDEPLDIDPEKDLYSWLLFQGPLYQRIENIYSLDSKRCIFSAINNPPVKKFPSLLGDPFFRDSLLQSAQLLVSQDICLPVRIESLDQHKSRSESDETLTGITIFEGRFDNQLRFTVLAVQQDGKVVESLNGYICQIMEHHSDYPIPEEIAQPGQRDENNIHREISSRAEQFGLIPPEISAKHIPGLTKLSTSERHKLEIPLLRKVADKIVQSETDLPKNFKISWLKSGRPVLKGKLWKDLDISLSHNEETLFCVTGLGPQGCDIESVTERVREDWAAMLGKTRDRLLNQLTDMNDSLDRAGTRIWTAIEAVRKALNVKDIDLDVERHSGDTVVFRGGTQEKQIAVLTFPILLTRRPERVIAIVCQSKRVEKAVTSEMQRNMHAERIQFDPGIYSIKIEGGPQGQPLLSARFPVTFRETANLSRTLYYSNYFTWIGKLREYIIHPLYGKMLEMFLTGKWGMITNHAETYIFGEAKSGDVIDGRIWFEKLYGKADASVELRYEWRKLLPDGGYEKIAQSTMSATWVAIRGHGVVEVQPFPDFAYEFLGKFLPPPEHRNIEPLPEETTGVINPGKELYRVPPGPVQESSLLREQVFETCLDDANLVGNIYFSNYYTWQGRVIDHFVYKTVPDYCRGSEQKGELRCIHCRVNHMNEAMPFDRVVVKLYPRAVYEKGVRFYFDYYRIGRDGQRVKLGHGEHEAVWYAPSDEKIWSPAILPKELRDRIIPKDKPLPPSMPSLPGAGPGEKYDVIVVGSGMGGLTAAALLANRGLKVTVLEQHNKPGGFCTSWERIVNHKGKKLRFVFDAGVHDVIGLGPGGAIRLLLETLGITDRIEWKRVPHEYYLHDLKFRLPEGFRDILKALQNNFASEKRGLSQLFHEMETCYHELYSISKEGQIKANKYDSLKKWLNVPFTRFLDTFIRDKYLKGLLSALAVYVTDDISKLDTTTFFPLVAYFMDGGFYPSGSSQVIPDTLINSIKDRAGTIQLKSAVSRILVQNNKALGVQLRNGQLLHADIVISNADVRRTYLDLVGTDFLQQHFKKQIENLQPSCSAFMVFLGVDCVPLCEAATFVINEQDFIKISIPSKLDNSLAPGGYSCITLICIVPNEQAVTWNRRDKGYKERKKQFGDKMILSAEKAIPDLRKHIVFREEASPATFARYAWTTDGSIYALALDQWRPSVKTPIDGLFLAGAANSGRAGIGDAVVAGTMAADSILKAKGIIL
jgi:enediyne polyketide synthase